MRRIICIFLSLVLLIVQFPTANASVPVSASSAILFCKDDGKVYFSLTENKQSKIASTTKIMTALLALEYASKDNINVEFTADMIAEGSSMYLQVGEVVTLYDLAVGLLLASGNDAANAVATAIAGSNEKFAELMNNRAQEIGMKNTNFVTPSGLDDPLHYSTAYDMALLMCEAMSNPDFAQITAMKSHTVDFVSPADKSTTYTNHNRLLSMYDYCIGGKTGYTMASGRCLVTVAKKDELTFVCVTFNDRNDFKDHMTLYDYGYDNYSAVVLDDTDIYFNIPTLDGENSSTLVSCEDITKLVLPKDKANKVKRKVKVKESLAAPVVQNTQVGKVIYKLDGEVVATHKLITVEQTPQRRKTYLEYIKELLKLWLQI